jgi:hypothetical protein
VKPVGKKKVYDISVADVEHYILENGVVTHNTGSYYSADNIFIIGRQQEKEGKEVTGYHFIVNVEKSRYVKEKSKIPISVSHTGGISKWSGLLDIALDGKFVHKPSPGWYSKVDPETGEVSDQKVREKDTNTMAFWDPILKSQQFQDYIKDRYQVGHGSIMQGEDGEAY